MSKRTSNKRPMYSNVIYRSAAIAATQTDYDIHTYAERETFTRLVGNVAFATDASTDVAVHWVVWLDRDGTSTLALSGGSNNIVGRQAESILAQGTFVGSATGQSNVIAVDVKGMRKVQDEDKIVFSYIGSTATGLISYAFKVFHKES